MKSRAFLLLLVLLLSGCATLKTTLPLKITLDANFLQHPTQSRIQTANPERSALAFLTAWQADDYSSMYTLLTPVSRDALPLDQFTERLKNAAISMTLQNFDYEILSASTNLSSAQVAYRVTFHTKMLGDLSREIKIESHAGRPG